MRGGAETRKIMEVRERSKLWSVLAVVGKSSCFWSCTQSEIEPANLQDKGLRGSSGSIDSGTKSTVYFPDLFVVSAPVAL